MTTTLVRAASERSDDVAVPPLRARRRGVRRGLRVLRAVAGWVLLAVGAVLLWPAPLGGVVGLTVVSGHSMERTYHSGDLVITARQPSYAAGDIVSYVVPAGEFGGGGRVIHRIVGLSAGHYTTQGDNNAATDPWSFEDGDVTGRAVAVLPGVGRLWSPQVFPFVIALAVGGIVTLLLWPSKPEAALEEEVQDAQAQA